MKDRYVVSDDWTLDETNRVKIIGDFGSEDEAAAFIATLPDYRKGRYNLDPPDSVDSALQALCGCAALGSSWRLTPLI
jgi:hypothetical protein